MKHALVYLCALILLFAIQCADRYVQPKLEARRAQTISIGRYQFKDLNKNGRLDPYEDWRLPVEDRIENLISLMLLDEKVGLMFHPNMSVPVDGEVKYDPADEPVQPGEMDLIPSAKRYIEEKKFRVILNNGVAEPKLFAEWSNRMQEIAEASRLGIPIVFSSDPRHGAILEAHVSGTQHFSQWPSTEGQYGITASRDTDLMKKYGEVTAEEFRAVGLHMLLGPQIDVTTEPRWKRNFGAFSESAELTAEMLEAFMDGAQGPSVGNHRILVMLKHWPGSGPHEDGKGDWLVYPGNNFEYHLIPWKAGINKGALAVMGYYSGTYYDNLGVNYSKYHSTDLLYGQLGFKGALCTDWFVIGMKGALRSDLVGIPLKDRFEISINAGVDQFGGESIPEFIVELVKEGRIPEERINRAAKHILQWHFALGLFEDPYVHPEATVRVVKSVENQRLGYQAQLKSIIMLTNDGTLPAAKKERIKLYISGIDRVAASEYAAVVDDPKEADLILVRDLTSDYRRGPNNERTAHQEINIDFSEKRWKEIKELAGSGVPVVVAFNLRGSLIVLPKDLKEITNASLMIFDVLDKPLLEVVFGEFNPVGKLPFELPSSMDAVRKQLEDVPFDSENPMFEFGHGLLYN